MSFWGALKKVGGVIAGVEPVAVSIMKLYPPTAGFANTIDDMWHAIQGFMVRAEVVSPDKGGDLKLQMVISDFEHSLQLAQSALALDGKQLIYDQEQFKKVVADLTVALNDFSTFKGTIKIEPLKALPAGS